MSTTYESPNSAGDKDRTPPASEHLQNLQDDAKAALDSVRRQGTAQFEHYRETAAEQIASLAEGAKSAAESLQDNDTLGLSHYVTDIAQSMNTLADDLRGKSTDELLHKAGKLAQDNPALFIVGSIALGFGLSRFLRASSPDINTGPVSHVPSDDAGNPFPSAPEFDPRTASDEELVTTPPHTGDVYHSGHPGTSNPTEQPDSEPLGNPAGYPGSFPDAGSPDRSQPSSPAHKGDL